MSANDLEVSKMVKIPFIFSTYDEFRGVDVNILYKGVDGDSKGADITGLVKYVKRDSKGADITGLVKYVEGDSKGVDITGLVKDVDGDSKGADITGLIKDVGGDSKGIGVTGLFNYSRGAKDFLILYGTLGNIVEQVPEDAFVLTIGLFNEIGDQYCPLINAKGIKNIPKLFKKNKKQKEKLTSV